MRTNALNMIKWLRPKRKEQNKHTQTELGLIDTMRANHETQMTLLLTNIKQLKEKI